MEDLASGLRLCRGWLDDMREWRLLTLWTQSGWQALRIHCINWHLAQKERMYNLGTMERKAQILRLCHLWASMCFLGCRHVKDVGEDEVSGLTGLTDFAPADNQPFLAFPLGT